MGAGSRSEHLPGAAAGRRQRGCPQTHEGPQDAHRSRAEHTALRTSQSDSAGSAHPRGTCTHKSQGCFGYNIACRWPHPGPPERQDVRRPAIGHQNSVGLKSAAGAASRSSGRGHSLWTGQTVPEAAAPLWASRDLPSRDRTCLFGRNEDTVPDPKMSSVAPSESSCRVAVTCQRTSKGSADVRKVRTRFQGVQTLATSH